MTPINIGTYEVSRGQIITLFSEGDSPKNNRFTLIYVKRSFNMSEKMVEYYRSLSPHEKSQPCEDAAEGLYRMLLKQGLVERPKSDLLHMGMIGRPSSRLADELRYSINPESYVLKKIQDDLLYTTKIFYNHQDYRVLLLGAGSSNNEVIIEVLDTEGVDIGHLKIGIVFDGTVGLTLNDEDTDKVRETIAAMIRETGHFGAISLGKIRYNFAEYA